MCRTGPLSLVRREPSHGFPVARSRVSEPFPLSLPLEKALNCCFSEFSINILSFRRKIKPVFRFLPFFQRLDDRSAEKTGVVRDFRQGGGRKNGIRIKPDAVEKHR